jgi:hypothetical protein
MYYGPVDAFPAIFEKRHSIDYISLLDVRGNCLIVKIAYVAARFGGGVEGAVGRDLCTSGCGRR